MTDIKTTRRRRPLLSVEQVSDLIGPDLAPVSSVRHWLATGRIPSVRVGKHRLVRRADLEAAFGVTLED